MGDYSEIRVLFLSQVLPYPLVGGAKIRAYYMLRHLSQNHCVTLVSFSREDDRPEYISHLRQFCDNVFTVPLSRSRWQDVSALLESLLTGRPAVIIRDRVGVMRSLLHKVVNNDTFDVIHADQTSMAQYGLYARTVAGNNPRTLLDQHNALYLMVQRQAEQERGWRRLLWRREARRLAKYEKNLCRQYDHILAVSKEDKNALLSLYEPYQRGKITERITVTPICVDPDERPVLTPHYEGPQILHLGTMFWPPNVEAVMWFAESVMPHILERIPKAVFTIAGKNPPDKVQALADPASHLAGNINVSGFVADPEPLLSRSQVMVVPLHAGGGMRVKILDAWLWGLPVVSTTIGAEGIHVKPGENILLADEPEAFANAVIRVFKDGKLAESLRKCGRQSVEKNYNWRTVYNRVSDVYGSLMVGGSSVSRRMVI